MEDEEPAVTATHPGGAGGGGNLDNFDSVEVDPGFIVVAVAGFVGFAGLTRVVVVADVIDATLEAAGGNCSSLTMSASTSSPPASPAMMAT